MAVHPHTKDAPVMKQFAFDGEWMPDIDPSKIGENNFALLRNFRYDDGGIAPVEGYTKLTTTPCDSGSTYVYPAEAIQIESTVAGDFIVCAAWNSDETASRLYYRTAGLADAGDFVSGVLFTPNAAAVDHRMAELPRGLGYANEYESIVWEGETTLPGAVLTAVTVSNLTVTNPKNYTNEVRNDYDGTTEVLTFDTTHDVILIGTTRPATSWTFTIKTPNTNASITTGYTWTDSGWVDMSVTDGTTSGGNAFSIDGTITTAKDFNDSRPAYIEGLYLYWYMFVATATIATISKITVRMPAQHIVDLWDGVYRTCISHEVQLDSTGSVRDYLLEINEPSNIDYPIGSRIGTLTDSGYAEFAFEERTAGIFFEIIGSLENTNAATATMSYWNGTAYTTVGTVYDTTLDGSNTLGRTGTITWSPPALGSEVIRTKQGVTGYFYRLTVSADLSGGTDEGILIDIASGIPAPRSMKGHKFPARYGQRAFWCADVYGNEPNAMDYGPPNTVDVYNGTQSSDRGQRIYVGDQAELTGATSIYNRFGSSIYETMLIFKNASTHLMYGTGPHDYQLYTISQSYGCPAPRTIAAAEIGYKMQGGASRNVAIWMSYRGPVIFDGAVLVPLDGVDIFFDPRKTDTYINTTYIEDFHGWFDPFWKEYHLLIATGSSTTLNKHIVYDLQRKRWFEIFYDAAGGSIPQVAFTGRDSIGAVKQLGMMGSTDTDYQGHLFQLEQGADWGGESLTHKVRTADFFVSQQEQPGSIFVESRMMELRLGHEVPDFEADATNTGFTISVNYYGNGSQTAEALTDIVITRADHIEEVDLIAEDGETLQTELGDDITYDAVQQFRYIKDTQALNKVGLTHQFEFSRVSTELGYVGNFGKNPLWWGFLAKPEGLDTR
jgi:hypothetical protein